MINIDDKSANPEVAAEWKSHIYDILGVRIDPDVGRKMGEVYLRPDS